MKVIVTYHDPKDQPYADIEDFAEMPRVGECICIADYDWWKITAVIHTSRQHEDGPPVCAVAERCERHPVAILKKSQTRSHSAD